jgi:uncharacterized protein YbbC (DUF1343 family)
MKRFWEIRAMKKMIPLCIAVIFSYIVAAQPISNVPVITGAERMAVYLPMLKGKAVAIFANQTSMVNNTHLVDTLFNSGIRIVKIFGPEHGFRGNQPDGDSIANAIDKKTGVPVISLYGDHKKPTPEELRDVDVLIYDIQDVGVRFYTFISSLQYFLEAALENHKPLLILDRPNPNGFYVDGPVLDTNFKSFIGMQPIPIVYGMTIGEYALFLTGENLLSAKANAINAYNVTTDPSVDTPFHVQVIKCKNYDHTTRYSLPVMPSPNLKKMQAIYLYPTTCLFEGTVLSEGRGTEMPFQVFGHPTLPKSLYSFTPKPNEGSRISKCFNQLCYGWKIDGTNEEILKIVDNRIQLKYLIQAYSLFPGKDTFFLQPKPGSKAHHSFDLRAGNSTLRQQIKDGVSEADIRKSWEPKLAAFKATRKKYLLYTDFE